MICFCILGKTLCGKPYEEPSEKVAKDGRFCEDCIEVMWKEQYRRNTLMPYIKKARKRLKKPEHKEKVVQHQMKKLFLKDWTKYGEIT